MHCTFWFIGLLEDTYLGPLCLLSGHYFLVVQWGQPHLNEYFTI